MSDTEEEMRKETDAYADWIRKQAKEAPPLTANAADLFLHEDATDGDEDDDDESEEEDE